MEGTERMMVQRLVRLGDSQAFSRIMHQYAGMVYGTCRRILGNDADAADAAQETFFHLLQNADRITGSLGGWLHQVATRRAIDRIRQEAGRRRRQDLYAANGASEPDEWSAIEPLVDESLEELPDDLREVLILHFLKGQTMSQIAAAKGSSQPTISRRVAAALEMLRQLLRNKDVAVGLAPLSSLLAASPQSAPGPVLQALGKVAVAQAASSGATAGAAAAPGALRGSKAALAATTLAIMLGVFWITSHRPTPAPPPNPAPPRMVVTNSFSFSWTAVRNGGVVRTTQTLFTNGVRVPTQTPAPPGLPPLSLPARP